MADLGAFFGNPNLQRQVARARALAEKRDVNTLADPRTYAAVQGLLGTVPDQMGFSVLHPDYQKIRETAEPAYALGLLGQAAPVLAPLTKGLPVGASIKNVGKFDVVKRDASDIFGEGAQRIRYTDPKSSGSIEVLAKPDGTASVLSLEVPEKFRGKKIGENLQKQVLEDFPDMQGQVSSKAAATTAYRIGRRPVDMPDATLKDVHKMIDEDSSVNMISPQMQQRISPSASYPQQEALDTAQRNAALPIEEGGLGLPKDNTPEMRAEAMGYKTPAYHGTTVWEADDGRKLGDIEAFNRLASTEIVGRKPSIDQMGIWASDRPDASGAGMYSGSQGAIYPLMLRMENPKATSFEQMARTASNLSSGKVLSATEVPKVSDVEPYRQLLKEQGFDSLMLRAKEGSPYTEFVDQTGYVLLDPSQVRSRFAAFDPMRTKEADILAGVLPLGLLTDEEQRKKLYELVPTLLGQ
jgi:hypothetical protein